LDNFTVPSRVLRGDFTGWLRDAMTERGFSTRMLAIRAGVDHSTIYRLTTGERQPSLATAMALLRILAPVTGSDIAQEVSADQREEIDLPSSTP
jgi:transcriptional regulator with XRE-family HTH domain